ncbi:MAG: hypothetical protein HY202_04570 [Nitrospirae bacterium]|nr:hypothetical protein [Nitrospirota bacterium]
MKIRWKKSFTTGIKEIVDQAVIITFYVIQHEKRIMRDKMESKARSMVASLALQGTHKESFETGWAP